MATFKCVRSLGKSIGSWRWKFHRLIYCQQHVEHLSALQWKIGWLEVKTLIYMKITDYVPVRESSSHASYRHKGSHRVCLKVTHISAQPKENRSPECRTPAQSDMIQCIWATWVNPSIPFTIEMAHTWQLTFLGMRASILKFGCINRVTV